jgi:hypothetical protein
MNMKANLRSGLRIAIAMIIALLTMVSPLCAPLCAATACASGNSADPGTDSCHHAASASTADASGAIAAPQQCNLKELPTAALRDARSSMEGHAKRSPSLHACATAADESPSQSSPSLELLSPATANDKLPATTVLRI